MERERSKQVSLLMWALVAGLLSQNLVIPATSTSFEEEKNYYPVDPPTGTTPPTVSHGTPPPHGNGGTPPYHGTPSHGGGYHPTPSTPPGGNCGTPPHHDPSTPTTPSRPSHPPSHGGYYPPPTSGGGSPPTYGGSPPTYGGNPPTPVYVSPPSTPIDPGTPSIPTPPFFPAPTPPIGGTCDFWRSHPTLIWGLLGWWGTVGNVLGIPTSTGATGFPGGFGTTMTLPQALSNTRTDGFGALYREGTASFLNSMANNRFPFSTKQVRESFVAALHSNRAAAAQANLFKLANEGHLKPRT